MQTVINRLEDGTIELTITIPWKEVKKSFDGLLKKALAEVTVPGFRKGKAPRKLAEEKIEKKRVYEEVIKQIIPEYYAKAIQQENIKPIISPRIELVQAKEGKDWRFKAFVCEKPKVNLGSYQQTISNLKIQKPTKIWTPGQKKEKEEQKGKINIEEILKALFKEVKISIPRLLIEEEVNRMLSRLIDDTKKLGLTLEQYLKTKGKTGEQLKRDYRQEVEKTLTLEFALEEIAEKEKITVDNKEIDELIEKEKEEKVKENLRANRYYLATVLRRRKTLDYLQSLTSHPSLRS